MNMHQVLAYCVLVAVAMATLAAGSPLRNHFLREPQACGDQLANIMRLVCSGKGGYNIAFRPEHHRARRGIVEECCYRACTLDVLEQYCQGEDVEIKKCSDESTDLHTAEEKANKAAEGTSQNTIKQDHVDQKEIKYSTTPKTLKENEEINFKLLNFVAASENISKKNKLIPNDTTEDVFRGKLRPLRHQKHHQRQLRGRKSSVKTKRDKSTNLRSFQIGTVKPYFVARPVASRYL